MFLYFQKADGRQLERKDFTFLSLRFCCEAYGSPVFGTADLRTFEFLHADDVTQARRRVLQSEGYVEVLNH